MRTILSQWYADKKCVFCGQAFGDVQWAMQKPALLTADQTLQDCSRVPAESLPEVLAAAKPVCFACYTATSWVKEHPDLVVDRSNKTSGRSDK